MPIILVRDSLRGAYTRDRVGADMFEQCRRNSAGYLIG